MRKTRPQVELEALVYLVQAAAEVAGVLADREGVCARGDFNAVKIALDVARQTAAVAGNDEADTLGVGDVVFTGALRIMMMSVSPRPFAMFFARSRQLPVPE